MNNHNGYEMNQVLEKQPRIIMYQAYCSVLFVFFQL